MTKRLNDVTPEEWDKSSKEYYKKLDEKLPDDYWDEDRTDVIGQNGNDGLHYKEKSKYHKTIKGVEIDVYDVLDGFKVYNPAIQHAVKKLLMGGNRGYKSLGQDYLEAIESIKRGIELNAD